MNFSTLAGSMRLFIAVNFPSELRTRWVAQTEALRSTAPDVRWLSSAQMHLTVAFLGEHPETIVEELRTMLDAITRTHTRLALETNGVGAFPDWRRPRVVWLGIVAVPSFMALAAAVARGCRALGISGEDRVFRPHITLARIDARVAQSRLRHLAAAARTMTIQSAAEVRSIDLMASTLGSGGAKHELIHRAVLGSG